MKLADEKFIRVLQDNGCTGDLSRIELAEDIGADDLQIANCEFHGTNKFYGKGIFLKSVFKSSVFYPHCQVFSSTILNSQIGSYTVIKDNSVVKNCTTSGFSFKQSVFPVLINDSQMVDDVILGGTDFNQTKSRGQSLFLFAHIGGGEFVRSTVIGTPPSAEVKNSLVEVGHFGYFGDLNVLGFAIKAQSGNYLLPEDNEFYQLVPKALAKIFLNEPNEITVETGRSNFGAGTTVSNYDPIKGTKAGATFWLSSCGASVSLSSYLTVLPGSLIATGSVDLTRTKNVIGPNTLAIGAREQTVILDGYLTDEQKQILNDRSKEEINYLLHNLRLLKALASFFAQAAQFKEGSEKLVFINALKLIETAAKKLAQKSIPKYFDLVKMSVKTIEASDKKQKYETKLEKQKNLLDQESAIVEKVKKLDIDITSFLQDENKVDYHSQSKLTITLTQGQEDQLANSLVNMETL